MYMPKNPDDVNTGQVEVVIKPPRDFISTSLAGETHPWAHPLPLFHPKGISREILRQALLAFQAKQEYPLLKNVEDVVLQIKAISAHDSTIILIGASPKLVKWRLQALGMRTVTLNVSGVAEGLKPSQEFLAYFRRKLDQVPKDSDILLVDYAASGHALVQLRKDILSERSGANVRTVGLVTGVPPEKSEDRKRWESIDKRIVPGATFRIMLELQAVKFFVGRNTQKNAYADWSEHVHGTADETKQRFQGQKAAYIEALSATPAPTEDAFETFMALYETAYPGKRPFRDDPDDCRCRYCNDIGPAREAARAKR